ncbi:MAG: VPS10 domain-containing protein, partial [Salibacteraceae bacterium]
MKSYLIILSFLFVACFANAQALLENSLGESSNDFQSYVKNINDWKGSQTDENIKGYKWIQRWANFYETRTDGRGNLVSNADYIKTAQLVSQLKGSFQSSRASDSSWSPEGPDTLVGAYNPTSSHGVARVNCITFHPTDSNTYWVGVSQGGIWKTTNSGQSYTPINNNLPILRISDIAVDQNNPDVLYVSLGDYAYLGVALTTDGRKRNTHYGMGVYKSTDGGLSWAATGLTFDQTQFDQSLIRRVFVNPSNSQELIAGGISGVWHSNDGGVNWTQKLNEIIWDFEMNPFNSNKLIVSTGYISNLNFGTSSIWASADFGKTWSKSNAPIAPTGQVQRIEITVTKADSNVCYAVSCGMDRGFYAFYSSIDGGLNWSLVVDNTTAPNILEWYDGTGTGGQGSYDLTVYADVNNPARVFVGGINIWGSEDSGKTWNICSYWIRQYGFTPHADQHFLTHNPLDGKYYMCNDGGVFRTDSIAMGSWGNADTIPGYEFPTDWEDVSSGMQITSFYRVATSDSIEGVLVAGAQDNGSFYRDVDGVWRNVAGGDGMDCLLHPTDTNEIITSSQYGYVHKSRSRGQNYNYINYGGQGSYGWTTPLLRDPENSNRLFLGAVNLEEGFGFNNWSSVGFFPGGNPTVISAFDVSTGDNDVMVVAKRIDYAQSYNSQVFYTINGGNTWQDITNGLPDSLYITSVKIDDRNDKIIWASIGGFVTGVKIYETQNGGATWQNRSGNLPNIPVNCIEQDKLSGNNALYVGTDVGVYYTNDSLATWELYSKDLPNVIVSDLEIHYKTRRIYTST